MTLSPLLLALSLAVPVLLGIAVLRTIGIRAADDRIAYLGLAHLAGAFALGALYFAWLAAGSSPRSFAAVPVAVAAAWLAAAFAPWRRARPAVPAPPVDRLAASAVAALLLVVVVRIAAADDVAVTGGDEGNIWAAKAKAIWVAEGFNDRLGALLDARGPVVHPDYPVWNPLVQLWSFALAGGITHVANRVAIQAFAVSLLLIVAGSLIRSGRGLGLLLTAAFISSAIVASMTRYAMADLMQTAAVAACAAAWRRRVETGEARFGRLFALSLGAVAWAKNEGLMLALVIAAAAMVETALRTERRPLAAIARTAPLAVAAAVLAASQAAFNARFDLANDVLAATGDGGVAARAWAHGLERLPIVARSFVERAALDAGELNLLLVVFAGALILRPMAALRERMLETLVVLGACAGFLLVYLGTPRDLQWHIKWSMSRVLMQVTPVACMVIASVAARPRAARPVA